MVNNGSIPKRQKTEVPVNMPLLPKAYALIQKYKDEPRVFYRGRLLTFMSNQRLNKYIKEIAQLCGIKKELSFHTARHTFATTVTLTNGVPVETVSKMLGHTKLSTTQVYVHIVKQRISDDMKMLRQKLSTAKQQKKMLYNQQNVTNLKLVILKSNFIVWSYSQNQYY